MVPSQHIAKPIDSLFVFKLNFLRKIMPGIPVSSPHGQMDRIPKINSPWFFILIIRFFCRSTEIRDFERSEEIPLQLMVSIVFIGHI